VPGDAWGQSDCETCGDGRTREDSIMMKTIVCSTALLAASGIASAADFKAAWQPGVIGGGNVTVGANTYSAGHMQHVYGLGGSAPGKAAGQFIGGQGDTFRTFCIELQNVSQSQRDFTIVDVSAAPDPSISNPNGNNPYGASLAAAVHDVVWKAIDLGWINADLTANTATLKQLSGIQGAIWFALFDSAQAVSSGDATIQGHMNTLTAAIGNNNRVAGLRAMVAPNAQDQLYVVPLPPAAFAGLATLAGIAGVSRLRRR
jgi:hypothetical protein